MTHEQLKAKALSNPDIKAEYEALESEFSLLRDILLAREKSGLSQSEIAEKMGLTPANIKRFESNLISGKNLPPLSTIKKYAEAINCRVEIKLIHH